MLDERRYVDLCSRSLRVRKEAELDWRLSPARWKCTGLSQSLSLTHTFAKKKNRTLIAALNISSNKKCCNTSWHKNRTLYQTARCLMMSLCSHSLSAHTFTFYMTTATTAGEQFVSFCGCVQCVGSVCRATRATTQDVIISRTEFV